MKKDNELAACVRRYFDYVDERGLEAYFASADKEHRQLTELLMNDDTSADYKEVFWKVYAERRSVRARILRTLRRGSRQVGNSCFKSSRIRLTGLINSRPPRMAHLLLLMIPKRCREHLIGDLEEEFRTILLPEHGWFWSCVWYWGQTIQALGFYVWPLLKRILGLAAIWKVIGR